MTYTFRATLPALALGLIVADAALAQARNYIQIAGSSTVYPFASTVAENFAHGGKFKAPVVESTGTGGGFKLFCSGVGATTPDINDASRPITDGEKATCTQNGVTAIDEIRIGYDGIILAGNSRTKGFDVTLEQLWRAVAKTVPVKGQWVANPYKSWSDIDPKLPTRAIRVFGPAPNHGTRDALVELVLDVACRKAPELAAIAKDDQKKTCSVVREDGAWTDVSEDYALVMGKLKGDPDAMAVFTFSYLDQNKDKIRASKVDGIAASIDTIASGQYPVSRPLFIYVKHAHLGVIPGLREFVPEFVSPRAAGEDGYLSRKGLIPLPARELKEQQAKAKAMAGRK